MLFRIKVDDEKILYDILEENMYQAQWPDMEYAHCKEILVDSYYKTYKPEPSYASSKCPLVEIAWFLDFSKEKPEAEVLSVLKSMEKDLTENLYDYFEIEYTYVSDYGNEKEIWKLKHIEFSEESVELYDKKLIKPIYFSFDSTEFRTLRIMKLVGIKTIRDIII